jgi:deoxyribonuclease-4
MSVSGGVHTAFARGESCGCTTMQVFVKNANQWRGKAVTDEDIRNYKVAAAKSSIAPVVAHAAYLINLCAKTPAVLENSRRGFEDELRRCAAFGIAGLVVHPGAHMGAGEDAGIAGIAESLNLIHERTPGLAPLSVLESTAGQGTALGYRFEHLRAIIDAVEHQERVGVCLDTCHLFAAGYDLSTEQGWEETLRAFGEIVGFDRLVAIHVNDSMRERGSRIDRHEHIGKGRIGLAGFRCLMNDPRLERVPKILETEKSDDLHEDRENMALLRSLCG